MVKGYSGATFVKSPFYTPGRPSWVAQQGVMWIIIHGTASGTGYPASSTARDFATNRGASTHYIVGYDGAIFQCVDESDTAWGNGPISGPAGTSKKGGGAGSIYHDSWWDTVAKRDCNSCTISIEHSKSTDNQSALSAIQQQASFTLIKDILSRWGKYIPIRFADASGGITGHYSMDPVGRSFCPGPYPWDQLFSYLGGQASAGTGGTVHIAPSTPGKASLFTFPRVDNIGAPDPYGGFPKPDSNIQVPAGYPITAILPGTVTNVTHGVSFGAVVTIKFDTPPATNPKALYYFYEHLRSDIQVTQGQHVYSSQLIGYNGSSQAEGAQKVPVGFGLYAGPIYGSGGAWSITQAAIKTTYNPVALLDQAKAGTLPGYIDPATGGSATGVSGTTGGSIGVATGGSTGTTGTAGETSGGTQTYTPLYRQVHATLVSNPGFSGIAASVDEIEQFPGWIDLTNGTPLDIVGLTRSVFATIGDNFAPFSVRAAIVLLGTFLLILLLYKLVDDTGLAGSLAGLAVL